LPPSSRLGTNREPTEAAAEALSAPAEARLFIGACGCAWGNRGSRQMLESCLAVLLFLNRGVQNDMGSRTMHACPHTHTLGMRGASLAAGGERVGGAAVLHLMHSSCAAGREGAPQQHSPDCLLGARVVDGVASWSAAGGGQGLVRLGLMGWCTQPLLPLAACGV
jgi:hypothetical protein